MVFFSENIREHFIDTAKGKEYAISFKEDLAKDTAIIQAAIAGITKNVIACDTLVRYLRDGRIKTMPDVQKIYQANLSALSGFILVLTDRTSSQLKNSGGMRLIQSKKSK